MSRRSSPSPSTFVHCACPRCNGTGSVPVGGALAPVINALMVQPLTLRELCARLRLDRAIVNARIQRLLALGILLREPDATIGQAYRYRLRPDATTTT